MSRKDPSTTTITKLILASAAKCSFPGCNQQLIENDQLIGQICHIEAASPGGQRYNPSQTDDERRSYENLILLCANHHKVTDDENEYTVEKLKAMKRAHEEQVEDEPTIDLVELNHVIGNLVNSGGDEFRYVFSGSFQPYMEYEYINDTSKAEAKLRGELQHIQRVAGHSSATDYAQQIFGQQLAKAKQPFVARKQASDKMYALELSKIEDFYKQLHDKEMSKLRQRGMGFSGQVQVLEEKIAKYKDTATQELNIMYGKA
jgi:hypothetical protein